MTTLPPYEKENELFFLFHPCAARDLGLFRNCSRMFQGTKGTFQEHPCCSFVPPCAARDLGHLEQKNTH